MKEKINYKLVNISLCILIVYLIYLTRDFWFGIINVFTEIAFPFLIAFSFAILFILVCVLSYSKTMKLQQKSVLAYGNTISVITDIIMNLSSVIFFCKKDKNCKELREFKTLSRKE